MKQKKRKNMVLVQLKEKDMIKRLIG